MQSTGGVESLVRVCRRQPLPPRVSELAGRNQELHRRRFLLPGCRLQEAIFLVEKRTSLSWIAHGKTRISTSLQSLPGLGSGSPRLLTIGSAEWLLKSIVLPNSFLAGRSTDRAPAVAPHPPMNFLMRLSTGLAIPNRGPERPGRRAKDWRSSSRIIALCCCWMVWSHFRIRLVHKKDGYVSLRYRHFCESLLPSIRGYA